MVRRSTRGSKRSHSAGAEERNEVATKKTKISEVVKKSPASRAKRVAKSRTAVSKTKSPSKKEVAKKPSLKSKENVSVVILKLPARATRANISSKQAKTEKLDSGGDKQIVRKSETRSTRINSSDKKGKVLKSPKKAPAQSERSSTRKTNGQFNKKSSPKAVVVKKTSPKAAVVKKTSPKAVVVKKSSPKAVYVKKSSTKVDIVQKNSLRASRRLSSSPKKNYAHMQVFGTSVANSSIVNKASIKKPSSKDKTKNARPKPSPPSKTAAKKIKNKQVAKKRLAQKKNNSSTPKSKAPSKRRSTTVKRSPKQSVKRVPRSVKRQNGTAYSEADVQIAKNTKLFVSLEKLKQFEDSDNVIKTENTDDDALVNGNAAENNDADNNTTEGDDTDKNTTEDVDADKNATEDVDAAVNGDADQNSIDAVENSSEEVGATVNGEAEPNATEDIDAGASTDAAPSTTENNAADNSEKSDIADNNNESVDVPDDVNETDDANKAKEFRLNLDAEDESRDVSQDKETSKSETKMDISNKDEEKVKNAELVEDKNEQTGLREDLPSKEILTIEDSDGSKSSTSEVVALDFESDPAESVEDIVAKLHGSGSDDEKYEPRVNKTTAKKMKKETTTEVELKITYSKCHVTLDSDEEKPLNSISVKSEQVSTLKTIEEISDCSNEVETFSASLKAQVLRRYVLNPNFEQKNEQVSFSIVSYNVGGQKYHRDLINEIILLKPSILCLQDINESYFKNSIECGLRLHNYNGVFTGSSNAENGLAMFYHTSHFELIQNDGYNVNNLLNKEIQNMAISSLEKEQLLSFLKSEFDQVNIIKIKSKVNEKELTICSVNLVSTNELIVGIQASTILSEVLRGNCKDYIICGTFHLEEDSYLHQFLKGGSMNIENLEEVKKKFPGDDVTKTELLRSLLEGLQRNCKDLKSSYSTILGHELCFPQSDKRNIKNSIWFSNSGLQIRNVLDAIAKSPLTDDVLGSHISLKSEFQFI